MISSKKITLISVMLVIIAFALTICLMVLPQNTLTENVTGDVIYSDLHTVSYSSDDYYTNYSENSIAKITLNGDSIKTSSKNVAVDGSDITILGGGTYVLSGTLNGNITVNSTDGATVRLVLNGVDINSPDFSALYVKQAKKVILSLVEGTENTFTDSSSYNEEKLTDSKPDSAIYSKDDLTINGKGTLIVNGNLLDGIKANDVLKITGGNIKITSVDEGINANDYIAISNTSVEISAGGDSIKCGNEDTGKGFIVLENSTLTLNSESDGIYSSSSIYANEIRTEISAGNSDDAIHGEKDVILDSSTINITKCNEGIEGAYVTINSGDISIISIDDGINAVGENSGGGFGMPMAMHKENIPEEEIYLTINGGNICIETNGDGIDSNGAAVINGGNIQVYGPENSGNSSLDFQYGFIINGGRLLAAGSSGMAELPSNSSKQNSIAFYLEKSFDAGSTISITDSNGNEVISGTSAKKFNWVCVSTESIQTEETYTLFVNGNEIVSVKSADIVTSSGSNRGGRW